MRNDELASALSNSAVVSELIGAIMGVSLQLILFKNG
jgi:hypothetical protein